VWQYINILLKQFLKASWGRLHLPSFGSLQPNAADWLVDVNVIQIGNAVNETAL
jgi:hypothetical protein